MKFTCDSCSAQYMISDEKVGPSGVKVRCKKCGTVIVVRRAAEPPRDEPPAAGPAPGANGATAPGSGLEAELGHAFDAAFGDPPAPQPAAGADLGATQLMGTEDAARISALAAAAPSPAPTEWYVAIGQAQVGPLPLAEVKRKWEGGDVGPDSLVWRPGMGDWQPLSSVGELAGYLAPVPRAAAQPQRAEPQPSRVEAHPARDREAPAAAGGGDVEWKPVGASALAALASEEIAARAAPDPRPAPRSAAAAGAASLVDALPDGGGVDPTGAIPLSIKALETTGEKKIERRSSVASRAEQARHRRSVARAAVIGGVVVVAVAGAAAAWFLPRASDRGAPPAVAAVEQPPAAATPAAPPPAAAPAPVPAPAPDAAPPQPVAAAPAAPAAPPAAPSAERAPPRAERRVAKAEPRPARREAPSRREAPARAEAPAAEAPPAPAPAPSRKKDGLLDFDTNDSALDEALGGGSSGRSVYVPPARAAPALPDKLSPAQINESVANRIDALRKCVSEQKSRDPDATGVLKLRWTIAGDGSVRDVKTLTTEYAQGPFSQCITGVVRSIRFPRSATAGQEVTFPFSF
jgi:predicted Zn finger-like uncharacterized protein